MDVLAVTVLTFWDVVAVPVTLPVTAPTCVPKMLVAVTAVPVKLPENTSAVSTFVLGLYCNPASLDKPIPVPVAFRENITEWLELLAPAAKFTFCDVVAVPVTLPVRVPKKFVAVTAVPVTLPENVVAVNTSVPGLYVNCASEESATPEAPFIGEKVR